MSLLIKNWQMADWKELLKWAKIGANNAMIGEFTEVEEVPPHGRLVDADVLFDRMEFEIKHFVPTDEFSRGVLSGYRSAARASRYASTIIPASEEGE